MAIYGQTRVNGELPFCFFDVAGRQVLLKVCFLFMELFDAFY